jgi:hypothetical protein
VIYALGIAELIAFYREICLQDITLAGAANPIFALVAFEPLLGTLNHPP